MNLLEASGLHSYYGDSHILFDVSLHVARNEVVGLLGRNGAGKSTTLKSLMGVLTPRAGTVMFDGVNIAGRKSHAIARAGMQLVHEERRIFGSLNVEENLVLAGLSASRRLDRPVQGAAAFSRMRLGSGTERRSTSSPSQMADARARSATIVKGICW